MSYSDYYKAKLEGALLFQDFVVDISWQTIGLAIVQYSSRGYQRNVGESRTGVEIKYDQEFKRTRNLWIEVAEKARPREGPYAESGIYRKDNSWLYVIGYYDKIFFFAKKTLQQLDQVGLVRRLENNTKTSQGFLLRDQDAEIHACIILTPNASSKVAKLVSDIDQVGRELHALVKTKPGQQALKFQEGK